MFAVPSQSAAANPTGLPWHQFSLAELTVTTTIVALQCAVTTRYLEIGLPILFLITIPASYRLWCVRSEAMKIGERLAWTELWAEATLSLVMACVLLIPWVGVQLAWGLFITIFITVLSSVFLPYFPFIEVCAVLAGTLPPWLFLLWLMRQCAINEW